MKIIKYLFLLILILLVIIGIGGYSYLQYQKPKYNGEVKLEGLSENVEIIFDDFGIPHIYAANKIDAFKALGYVHAQERLFQMEMLRRVGPGRLSEILGKDFIEIDKFFRTLGIDKNSKSCVKALYEQRGEHLDLAEAYLEGINNYLETGPLPIEFQIIGIPKETFTLTDIYNSIGYIAFSFAQAFKTDPLVEKLADNLGESYMKDLVMHWNDSSIRIPVYFENTDSTTNPPNVDSLQANQKTETISKLLETIPVPPFLGSNSWVVAPQKTENGKVILANDTHIAYSQPSVWYEAHLEVPGFKYYGNFLAGFPFALVGHSDHHVIGLTMFENDDIDLYYEKVNPENPNQFWAESNWVEMKIQKEEILVKGAESLSFEVKETNHGPIVNDVLPELDNEKPVSAWWVYTNFTGNTLEAAYNLMTAKDIETARKGASQIHAPGLNVMYGDIDGNIAWWAAAKLPKRPAHVNPKLILDGVTGKDDILGYYDFDMNPQSENPPSGYIYSANNQPDTVKGVYHYGYYIPSDRAERIVELLENENEWNTQKIKMMMLDDVSPVYSNLAREIVAVIESTANNLNVNEKLCLGILKKWNGDHASNENAPVIFHHVFYKILAQAMIDEIGEDDFESYLSTFLSRRTNSILLENDSAIWWDDVNTSKVKESRNYVFIAAFKEAISDLEKRLGSDINGWKWEHVHTIEHEHALGKVEALRGIFNVGPFPIAGATEVINNQGFIWNNSGEYKVTWGPAMRRVIDFADFENSESILPTGQSGNIMSPFYKDQAEMFVQGKYRKQKMNREEIEQTSTGTLLLKAR